MPLAEHCSMSRTCRRSEVLCCAAWAVGLSLSLLAGLPASAQPSSDQRAKADAASRETTRDSTRAASPAPNSRPTAAGRLVRVFDFEERAFNPAPVPRFWSRQQDADDLPRPGFPRFNLAELTDLESEPAATRGAVRLPTRGGSTALILDPGLVPVFPNADYFVGVRVRTEALQHARALLHVRLLDERQEPIPGSDRYSAPLLSDGAWTSTGVEMPGLFTNASFLQIELLLLQPAQIDQIPELRDRSVPRLTRPGVELKREDFAGAALFDDVSVVQLPRLTLRTQAADNVLLAPRSPEIELLVSDLTGESLSGTLRVLDLSGRTVDTRPIAVGEGKSRTVFSPRLPSYGWYRAVLEMSNGELRVGSTAVDFVYLPAREASSDNQHPSDDELRFWLLSDDLPPALLPQMADALRALRSGGMTFPLWRSDLRAEDVDALSRALGPLVDSFRSDRRELAFSLPVAPAGAVDPRERVRPTPWSLVSSNAPPLKGLLDPILDRYGQGVRRWQIGGRNRVEAEIRGVGARELAGAESTLGRLVPGPIVQIPVTPESPLAAYVSNASAEPVVVIPPGAHVATGAQCLERWERQITGAAARRITIAFESDPDNLVSPADAVHTLVKAGVLAWASATLQPGAQPPTTDLFTPTPNATAAVEITPPQPQTQARRMDVRLALASPWGVSPGRSPQLLPRPELAAWRAMADRLVDRVFVGEIPLTGGGRGYLFANSRESDPTRSGLLVVWNDEHPPGTVLLDRYLGPGPVTAFDAFGNASPIVDTAKRPLPVGPAPVLLEGVDSALLRFMASLRLEPSLMLLTEPESQHTLIVHNPWTDTVSGQMALREPGHAGAENTRRDRSWRITPRVFSFNLPPGETVRLPVTIAFGQAEEIGTKRFTLDVSLAASRPYDTFSIPLPIELGVRDVAFTVQATRRGEDLIVEATVSNLGSRTLNPVLTAFPPERPRLLMNIGELLPGNRLIRRFSIPGVYPGSAGRRFGVSLADDDTQLRIVKSVGIP